MPDVNDVIRFLSSDSGLSLGKISENAGRGRTFLASYLSRDRVPSVYLMAEICDASGHDLIVRNRSTGNEARIDPPPKDE